MSTSPSSSQAQNKQHSAGRGASPILWLLPALMLLGGCGELAYYGQAAAGQWDLFARRQPVTVLLNDPATPPDLRRRLVLSRQLRDFAISDLGLPDNGSYRGYADLGRPYAVYNVFAAPELSLEPRQWCFPIIGCVTYRGYFSRTDAQALADALEREGWDVYVAGIPAYSTLGWFDDPLLNTFVHWPTGRLADLLFHELAHQRLYIDDDTVFNESFATAVGRLGARRFLARHGSEQERQDYQDLLAHNDAVLQRVAQAREALVGVYESALTPDGKRRAKQAILARLQQDYRRLAADWPASVRFDDWFSDLNNAKLGTLQTYSQWVPAFEALFQAGGRDFPAFYEAVEALGRLPAAQRAARLRSLASGDT